MSREFEDRYADWFKWYKEHHNDTDGIENQVKFLRKAVEGLMELLAHTTLDIRALEGRPKHDLGQPLYLPGPMRVRW